MPSAASRLVPLILRLTGRGSDPRDADAARRHIGERAVRRDVEVTVSHDHDWPVYTVAPTAGGRAADRRHHGVGFLTC